MVVTKKESIIRHKARKFIDELREKKSILTEAEEEYLSVRPKLFRKFKDLRFSSSSSALALADNLYAGPMHFVYELIQNAEDNSYDNAARDSQWPWLCFTLHDDEILIDSNEDGFTKADIESICSVGQSTKTSSQDHIGEKGLGFKSVFKVARKVHVQSEPYSFAFHFQPHQEDSGLGMVIPFHEDYKLVPHNIQTRTTLALAEKCEDKLSAQFDSLPDAILLFLHKLKKISICASLSGRPKTELSYSLLSSDNPVVIEKKNNSKVLLQRYWVTRHRATKMPENRARKNTNTAEVFLAFPLDADSVPLISDQYIFAFLPLEQGSFQFLIHADFITTASRERASDNEWNERLRDEVVLVFLSTVNDFMDHPTLRYHWVRFIPTARMIEWSRASVRTSLLRNLPLREVFFSQSSNEPRSIQSLRLVADTYRDEHGQPLLPDLASRKSIAEEKYTERIKILPIIPLRDGTWASPGEFQIYLPLSAGFEVPTSLPLKMVDPQALKNQHIAHLLSDLSIIECDPSEVIHLIDQQFDSADATIEQSVEYIKFLFWHNEHILGEEVRVELLSSDGDTWFDPNDTKLWTYCLRSDDKYASCQIFETTQSDKVQFPNIEYYDALADCERRNKQDALEWFRHFAHLQATPHFLAREGKSVSKEFIEIRRKHPGYLLGVLEANRKDCQANSAWIDMIKKIEVPLLHEQAKRMLSDTFIPSPRMLDIVARFGYQQHFPFLAELCDVTDESVGKWRFLQRFGVGVEEDLSFWIELLNIALVAGTSDGIDFISEIYQAIYQFRKSMNEEQKKTLRRDKIILMPSSDGSLRWICSTDCVWAAPDWFDFLPRLDTVNQYRDLHGFFFRTIKVSNAGIDHFIENLIDLKSPSSNADTPETSRQICRLYEALEQLANRDPSLVMRIKKSFEDNRLVYHSPSQSWLKPSSCVWANDDVLLPGIASIAESLQSQESFFTKTLEISRPTLEDFIQGLASEASSGNKSSAMRMMLNICSFKPGPETFKRISKIDCLPVRSPCEEISWSKRRDQFAIIDRAEHDQTFRSQIDCLDFSIEEVHSLEPFLLGLGLKDRYTSQTVWETSVLPEATGKNYALTKDLRRKAFAICRYIVALSDGSSGLNALTLCSRLEELEVYECQTISKHLAINMGGKETTVVVKGFAHIEESDEGTVTIFVPADPNDRELCLLGHLHIRILEQFGVPASAFGQGEGLASIIGAKKLDYVDQLLDRAGIVKIDGINRRDDLDYEPNSALGHVEQAKFSTISAVEVQERPELYRQLLAAVIGQAQRLSDLPDLDQQLIYPDMATRRLDTIEAVQSPQDRETEIRIGAAGELFVFEILQSLRLPDFDHDNWQSSIRDRVSVSPNYRNLEAWPGRETADIVYKDTNNVLTQMLLQKGYTMLQPFVTQAPTYYIEVKTTPSSCGASFYCSQTQLDRMKHCRLDGSNVGDVYLIARVFSLGDSGMGLRLYLDPWDLQDKSLYFTAPSYTVTPLD
ncbi:hypothetical protein FKW77_002385 [Venturia effusa]|uniref:Sacsin/Nov domain-containing protein n=1 Tax=Venturia effusa TaxID=50376 RepID=A0A517LC18_9PEZI|nr:hypothetical protein FKW77_002385 [Venturia effusa]